MSEKKHIKLGHKRRTFTYSVKSIVLNQHQIENEFETIDYFPLKFDKYDFKTLQTDYVRKTFPQYELSKVLEKLKNKCSNKWA